MRSFLSLRMLLVALVVAAIAGAQTFDPRTPAGQLTACGGAAAWQRIGFLEFEVTIETAAGTQGPWHYRWDRGYGFFRLAGPDENGQPIDVALDIASGTGGGWSGRQQLFGKALERTVSWSMQRFREDAMWVTFPLEWGAVGVSVVPLADVVDDGGVKRRAVQVNSRVGTWKVTLDAESGRVARTVLERQGAGTLTVDWSDWQQHGGVYFAQSRRIAETGETITVKIMRAQSGTPTDAF